MKVFIFALLLVAGASAMPSETDLDDSNNGRLVTGQIVKAIEELAKAIRDAGLDPVEIDRVDINESPVPILVTMNAFMEDVTFSGLSIIAINRMDYGALSNRLRFDVSLPKLSLTVGDSGVNANIFGNRITGSLRGSLEITQIRFIGNIHIRIGIISGIGFRSVDINFRIERINSALTMIFNGVNYTPELNHLLNERVPAFLRENQDRFDKAISDFVKDAFNNSRGTSLIVPDGILVANSL